MLCVLLLLPSSCHTFEVYTAGWFMSCHEELKGICVFVCCSRVNWLLELFLYLPQKPHWKSMNYILSFWPQCSAFLRSSSVAELQPVWYLLRGSSLFSPSRHNFFVLRWCAEDLNVCMRRWPQAASSRNIANLLAVTFPQHTHFIDSFITVAHILLIHFWCTILYENDSNLLTWFFKFEWIVLCWWLSCTFGLRLWAEQFPHMSPGKNKLLCSWWMTSTFHCFPDSEALRSTNTHTVTHTLRHLSIAANSIKCSCNYFISV